MALVMRPQMTLDEYGRESGVAYRYPQRSPCHWLGIVVHGSERGCTGELTFHMLL